MPTPNVPIKLEELKKIRQPVRDVNAELQQKLTVLERLAMWITEHVGTMGFFAIIFSWTVIWLAWNAMAPKGIRFDPAPAFVLWLFISNMIQLMLMPLLMIGQNLQSRHAEGRAKAVYEFSLRSKREMEAIVAHLEHQEELQEEILKKLDRE